MVVSRRRGYSMVLNDYKLTTNSQDQNVINANIQQVAEDALRGRNGTGCVLDWGTTTSPRL